MSKDIYDYFDLDENASQDEIKKAYRKKAKKNHPDLGGDQEDFEKCNEYYNLLMDSELRDFYNKTGKIKKENIKKDNFYSTLIRVFEKSLSIISDFTKEDVFLKMTKIINKEIDNFEKQLEIIRISNINIKEILKRIKTKEKENIFKNILEEKLTINKTALKELNLKIENHEKSLEFLNNFNYEIDKDINNFLSYVTFGIPYDNNTSATGGF